MWALRDFPQGADFRHGRHRPCDRHQLIGSGDALRTAVIFFYISNEGVSLLENAGHIGLPIPEKLKEVLAQLHNRTEDDKDTEGKE